jgi:two-component system phosphate regulon sensor histidine kinase PhoR
MKGIRWKLVTWFTLVMVLVLLVTGLLVLRHLEALDTANLERDLTRRARVVAEVMGPLPQGPGEEGDALATRMSQILECRVTLIQASGVVVGESLQPSATMEDHSGRPEVARALAQGVGSDTRSISTTGLHMMYVAVKVPGGVVRVSLSLKEVQSRLNAIGLALLAGGIACVLGVVALAPLVANRIIAPLKHLAWVAGRLATGEYGVTAEVNTDDELEGVAKALNTMARSVRSNVEALSRQGDRQRAILDHLADGVILFNQAGRIVQASDRACQLLGLSRVEGFGPEALGRTPEVLVFVRASLSRNEESSGVVTTVFPRDQVLQAHAAWVPDQGGKGLLITVQDITEVSRLNRLRQELVANLSHELKTPVGAVKALAECLEMGALEEPEEAREFVRRIVSESDRMSYMINEMLVLSEIEAGQDRVRQDDLDLWGLVCQAMKEMEPVARAKGIALESQGHPVPLRGDPEMLRRAVVNLLDNALKFSPQGTRVRLRLGLEARRVLLEVEDQGAGMTADHLPRVFQRFYKAEPSRKTPGAGLGLAVVKHAVRAHGGDVFGRSELGKGSVFGFWLPLGPEGARPGAEE